MIIILGRVLPFLVISGATLNIFGAVLPFNLVYLIMNAPPSPTNRDDQHAPNLTLVLQTAVPGWLPGFWGELTFLGSTSFVCSKAEPEERRMPPFIRRHGGEQSARLWRRPAWRRPDAIAHGAQTPETGTTPGTSTPVRCAPFPVFISSTPLTDLFLC